MNLTGLLGRGQREEGASGTPNGGSSALRWPQPSSRCPFMSVTEGFGTSLADLVFSPSLLRHRPSAILPGRARTCQTGREPITLQW